MIRKCNILKLPIERLYGNYMEIMKDYTACKDEF